LQSEETPRSTEQAWQLGATVATENVGHLSQFVPAFKWQEITAD
jgi:hypothetical protein